MKTSLALLLTAVCLGMALSLVWITPAQTQAGALFGFKICLDAGHGGSDPGAVNGDLYEKDINLDVAYALKALLEGEDATVEMARADDSSLDNSDRYTFCNTVQADILISIHTNSVVDPLRDGLMTLYFHADDKILAGTIHEVMYPLLLDEAPDAVAYEDIGLSKFASGVLLKSDMPAAMMEPVFMSHPGEATLLNTPIFVLDEETNTPTGEPNAECDNCRRAQIADAIFQGVLVYLAPPGANNPPLAAFDYVCEGLSCQFDASASTDADGAIAAYAWDFGDGAVGSGVTVEHTYAPGVYEVTLMVTDDGGASGEVVQIVGAGDVPSIVLTATGRKYHGRLKVDLTWSGATTIDVDVYRGGDLIVTTENDGAYTDTINPPSGNSFTYWICEAGTDTCSNEVTVEF